MEISYSEKIGISSDFVGSGCSTLHIVNLESKPLLAVLNVSPLLMAVSCCVGAISFSYFNDSGFWVFNGMFGLTEMKDQLRCKTAVSMIMSVVGIVELLICSMFM